MRSPLSIPELAEEFLVTALRGLGTLFFPNECPYCRAEGIHQREVEASCLDIWRQRPSIRHIYGVPIYSVVPYDDRAMNVVLAAKERGERRAKELLATSIVSVIERSEIFESYSERFLIIPIPSSERAIRLRGEDFIFELARAVIKEKKVFGFGDSQVLLCPVLRWRREIKDQSALSMQERVKNLSAALEVDERGLQRFFYRNNLSLEQGLHLVLIDDVVTSGSTLAAAISAISHSSLAPHISLIGITSCHSAKPF
jgi:predicted amidophosphoribosyltransferase